MPSTASNNNDLTAVLAELGIFDWDVALVGDGSGAGWKLGCGWACALIDRHQNRRKLLQGAMNYGTIGIAELTPYIHAMLWYDRFYGSKLRRKLGRPIHVRIITDNQTIAKIGSQLAINTLEGSPDNPLWHVLEHWMRDGYDFGFTWLPRMTIGLNAFCDRLAGIARLSAEALPTHADLSGEARGIYDLN